APRDSTLSCLESSWAEVAPTLELGKSRLGEVNGPVGSQFPVWSVSDFPNVTVRIRERARVATPLGVSRRTSDGAPGVHRFGEHSVDLARRAHVMGRLDARHCVCATRGQQTEARPAC